MRLVTVAAYIFVLIVHTSFAQTTKSSSETRGACSPIANNNQGSITIRCTGFSAEQNKQILEILHQLSLKRSRDQDAVLSKLNEVLATVRASQRQSASRVISPQQQSMILNSSWGECPKERILITAPNGDPEAQALAVQLEEILNRAGMESGITYDSLTKEAGDTEDLKIVYDEMLNCSVRNLVNPLKSIFQIGTEPRRSTSPPVSGKPQSRAVTTRIYVYRR